MYRSLLLALLGLLLAACPTNRANDDDSATDDDDAVDDDDAIGDDDDSGQPDDDDAVVLPDCADQGGVPIFLDGDVSECEVEWEESSVSIRFVEAPDCGGACNALLGGGDALLQPAAMKFDLGDLDCTVRRIEVELTDSGGVGTAAVLAVDSTGAMLGMEMNTQVGGVETIEVDPGGYVIEAGGVMGCDTAVHEIRVY